MNNGNERTQKSRPNLFDYATSELSQDAFLIWLIRYADPQFQDDLELHRTAQTFVRLFLDDYTSPIKEIKVWKQWSNIDITVEVNGAVGIIIEDKVGAHLHDDQLRRYREAAEKWARDEHLRLGFFYLNTENPNTDDRENIKKAQYKVIMRSELLRILNGYSGVNPILCDFRDKLSIIENETTAYKMQPFNKWSYRAWQGFYEWLRTQIVDCNWNYAANQTGGVWWFQWNVGKICSGLDFYLQFEHHPDKGVSRLCFKAYSESGMMPRVAPVLRAAIEAIRDANGWAEIEHVDRFRTNGTSCTIMCVQMEHLTEGGKIHLNTFHKKLARYERIVDEVRSRVEFALQDEKSVKEFLTGDVIQLLKSISGFEWKTKTSKFALEDFNNGSIRYYPVHGRLPRNFSIQCIFQEPLMVDCQVGGCSANGDIPMPDDSKAWLSKHGKIKNGWSVDEDRWWPIWRHIGGDHGITMDHETVVRLMSDYAYRDSIAEEIAKAVFDIFRLVTR